MLTSPTRHRVALGIALLGVAVSGLTMSVHSRIVSDSGYTSFCNFGDVVNCDAVLGSRYGQVFGVSVSALAVGVFAMGAVLSVPGAVAGAGGGLMDLGLLGLASGSLGFALVLGAIAGFVLHHACLLCLSLDVVVVAWFFTVAPLAMRFDVAPRSTWWRQRRVAQAMAAVTLVVAVAAGTFAAVRTPGPAETLDDVKARDAKFYDIYMKLPVVPMAEVAGSEAHVKGRPDAEVTIVEFSDFACPACGLAFPDLRDLVRSRSDVRLVFRHFPLDASCNPSLTRTLHADACLAAEAAECAGAQNRFWEYHDTLFENQKNLDRQSLFRYARDVGLDIATFRTCLDDPATRARVSEDVAAGMHAELASTPTLFINGRRVQGALDRPYYDYALVIEKHERDARVSRGG
jgi:protein-disulfide isomerase/uncharacterized membrane protein